MTMKTRICNDDKCVRPGKEQPISAFPKSSGCVEGRSHQCKACKNRTIREYNEPVVKRLGNNEFLVNFVKYKLGINRFVFTWLDGEWIKSQLTESELMRMVRNG